ncbi:unnamed protein product, partial [Cuscuta epithymum]
MLLPLMGDFHPSLRRSGTGSFLLPLLLLGSFLFLGVCYGDDKTTAHVVGFGECSDCKDYNIQTSHAFSGLRVTVDCKVGNGEMKTRGVGEMDKDGKFHVSLPKEMVMDSGELKEECYAQLHSASSTPCPAHNGIKASKIVAAK